MARMSEPNYAGSHLALRRRQIRRERERISAKWRHAGNSCFALGVIMYYCGSRLCGPRRTVREPDPVLQACNEKRATVVLLMYL